ncbi:pantetheine-phosphate adenylyltransferase [Magnetofaba australis]|uniref:Phosphopantetheine adenylyltransferase n=1 Tax=Magnetofaba australis IT-1 TaxID=1434232 RepID=A0A1Y2K5B7_9PROT|nr:pantetheine-phosphate adenylyltransferase [Magnetofaba australis]OSM04829.1 putative phosphopantetheine adenylyltransferase [Magnetofaba australis IT-1]
MSNSARIAIYAGSFDPITLGHLDIIKRGAALFDTLVVGVAVNRSKKTLFSAEQRLDHVTRAVADLPNVHVRRIDGLLVQFAKSMGAQALLRGLRVMTDFEYEFQMAAMNRQLAPSLETLFLTAEESTTFISSSMIKEIACNGGDVTPFVPALVIDDLRAACV